MSAAIERVGTDERDRRNAHAFRASESNSFWQMCRSVREVPSREASEMACKFTLLLKVALAHSSGKGLSLCVTHVAN